MLSEAQIQAFQAIVLEYYWQHGRHDLPWRQPSDGKSFDAYAILVSELMLQQTQVVRVIPKFISFMQRFPDVYSLVAAPLGEVLIAWSGLGYNRRAKFLHQAAQYAKTEWQGVFPADQQLLTELPGVGLNTSGAIMAYAFNQPVVFVETNIRTVFIHHFFSDQQAISDKVITEFVMACLPATDFRKWYWAIMDYGAYLKQTVGNLNMLSNTYAKQSTFHGSKRQLRGQLIRLLSQQSFTLMQLQAVIGDARLFEVLTELLAEKMIHYDNEQYHL